MNTEKPIMTAEIKRLSNLLDKQYATELNFRNHCYLRIAYDRVVNNKWDLVVQKPFVKYADEDTLQRAIELLKLYVEDKKQLQADNEKSLEFRRKDAMNSSRTDKLNY